MSTLASRLKKFSENSVDNLDSEWTRGVANENARLQPLLEALIECAVQLEHLVNPMVMQRTKALARLEALLPKEEK